MVSRSDTQARPSYLRNIPAGVFESRGQAYLSPALLEPSSKATGVFGPKCQKHPNFKSQTFTNPGSTNLRITPETFKSLGPLREKCPRPPEPKVLYTEHLG